jgi:undecaprenyl-diphosphatase
VWRGVVPTWRLSAGPLRFAGGRLTPGDLGLELTTLLAIAVVGTFGFFAIGDAVGPGPTALDRRAFTIADQLRSDAVVDAAKIITDLGSLPAVALLVLTTGAALLRHRHAIEAAALTGGLALTFAAVHIAKAAYDRPRPEGALIHSAGAAYPSGHSAYSIAWIAVAVALARGVPRFAGQAVLVVVALVVAALIGWTRVELRAHYLTDVLGGWALGAAIFALCGVAGLLVGYVRHNDRPR